MRFYDAKSLTSQFGLCRVGVERQVTLWYLLQ